MTLHLDPAAYDEVLEAAAWYNRRQPGVGDEFLDVVDCAIDMIRENSETGSFMETLDDPNIRRVLLNRFPYSVIDQTFADEIHILAVMHQSRRPNYWLGRRRDS